MTENMENKALQEEAVSTEAKAADEKAEKKIEKEPKKTTAKTAAKKAADGTKKTTARKSPAKKTTAKKTVKKEPTIGMTLQGPNQEFDIIERIKNDWTEKGHKISEIEHIQTYIKLCDSAVYYVINGDPELKGAIYY